MSMVRVLVGTRKGAFILTSDAKRARWEGSGPLFGGWEFYHLQGAPADPQRLYASQSSGWFGQQIQRSSDGGTTWEPVGNKFAYDGVPGTHQWYDGTPHPWEFARVWHLEPSLDDPDTVYAGVQDAALFRSTDGGGSWHELSSFWSSPGFVNERVTVFAANGLEEGEPEPDEGEDIEVVRWTLADVEVRLHELEDATTLIGLLLYLREAS